MDDDALIEIATGRLGAFPLGNGSRLSAGQVAAALVTATGRVHVGICLDLACGIGFCAEHSAVAAMLLERETVIAKIVAVHERGILPPCGRCRELMIQVDARNAACEVILPGGAKRPLSALIPDHWIGAGRVSLSTAAAQ